MYNKKNKNKGKIQWIKKTGHFERCVDQDGLCVSVVMCLRLGGEKKQSNPNLRDKRSCITIAVC